ncbi:MAG: helix-turn-helix domain-containing protein [Chloroflexota bacterium]|nr:helix-turn-helix domain-containing protein [Chloroflexota bacterium]
MNTHAGGNDEGALTITDVCAQLNIKKGTVYHLIRTGALPAFRLGPHYRIEPQDLQHFKESRKALVAAAAGMQERSGLGDAHRGG